MFKWLIIRKADKDKQQYDNGFDYAAGVILRNEETSLSIEEKYGHMNDPFDQGMDDAISTLISLGYKDNRI